MYHGWVRYTGWNCAKTRRKKTKMKKITSREVFNWRKKPNANKFSLELKLPNQQLCKIRARNWAVFISEIQSQVFQWMLISKPFHSIFNKHLWIILLSFVLMIWFIVVSCFYMKKSRRKINMEKNVLKFSKLWQSTQDRRKEKKNMWKNLYWQVFSMQRPQTTSRLRLVICNGKNQVAHFFCFSEALHVAYPNQW